MFIGYNLNMILGELILKLSELICDFPCGHSSTIASVCF